MKNFRNLFPNEIRIKNENGKNRIKLSLWKKSRVDTNILDESGVSWTMTEPRFQGNTVVVGIGIENPMRQMEYRYGCSDEKSIFSPNKTMLSDAICNAGLRWGIGAELYTPPKMLISIDYLKIDDTGAIAENLFTVKEIFYNEKKIDGIIVENCSLAKGHPYKFIGFGNIPSTALTKEYILLDEEGKKAEDVESTTEKPKTKKKKETTEETTKVTEQPESKTISDKELLDRPEVVDLSIWLNQNDTENFISNFLKHTYNVENVCLLPTAQIKAVLKNPTKVIAKAEEFKNAS